MEDGNPIPRRHALSRILSSSAGAAFALSASGCARKLPPTLNRSYHFLCADAPEIVTPGKLIGPDGRSHCGWMRQPLLDLNLEDARFYVVPPLQQSRLKKWEMYYLITPTHYLSFLPAWIGYAAFAEIAVYDRQARTWQNRFHLRGPLPKFPMMRNSNSGITEFAAGKDRLRIEVAGERRKLTIDFPGFPGGFQAGIKLHHPAGLESICGVHLDNPRRVFYGEKVTSMPASGSYRIGGEEFPLDPERSWGLLDFGRGYYPLKKFWYWATASGRAEDGAVVGWNLGYGNSSEETTENALFHDGRLHKLGRVRVELDFQDFYRPWRVWSDDGRVDLSFTPENVRFNQLDLGLLYSVGRTALGLFNGSMVLDSGARIGVRDLFGLFEVVDQRW
jgi:hypothetical protein